MILVGQSIVLGEVKAETLVHDEDPMNDQIIWQQYIQQVESLSPENRVSKFCKEAGFMRVVEVGQYFVTKDTGDFRQFRSVACREYTLPRDDPASQPKGWIQGNMRIGPVLEVTTSFQYFKYGIEIRIWSVNQDNSQSWVRISYGTVKYVIDSIQDNPTEAMQWIKEVELVDSVDELRSSSSIRGISMPNFEVLDWRIASALNKIIRNSQFIRRISLEEQEAQKEDRFLRGRQIAHLIYDHFRVTGSHDSVEKYADLSTISLRNDEIQEFDSKWDGILLSMMKIPHDDILEGLYKLRIRESEKLKTELELYDLETHQKKLGPDYHRLKTMVKRSIEQEIRNNNFGIRNGNFEKNAVVKNQGAKQRVQRILGDCWQWEINGQCVKGDNCSFRHDMNKRGKSSPSNPSPNSFMQQSERKPSRTRSPKGKSPSGRMSRWPCKDYLRGTCNNSSCKRWHPPECLFYKTKSGCRFGEKCPFAHRQVDEQPTKRSKTNNDKSAVAMLNKHEQYDSSNTVKKTSNMELKFESGLWVKTILNLGSECPMERTSTWLNLGSEYPMERTNTWLNQFKTTQKFLEIHKKSKFHKQARVWLQPGQRQKQNLNRENLLGRQQPYQYTKEDGLTLSHQNKILLRTISRRKSLIFFDTIRRYSEKKMEQLNSAR